MRSGFSCSSGKSENAASVPRNSRREVPLFMAFLLRVSEECCGCYDGVEETSTCQPAIQKVESASKAPKEFIEFVGSVEIAFEFAGSEAFAKIVEPPRKEIQRGGKHFLVGEHNVAPRGVRTPRTSSEQARIGEES